MKRLEVLFHHQSVIIDSSILKQVRGFEDSLACLASGLRQAIY
jgi:hypothetical protein